ncbi:SGNH/GDSL hydrolase family protein [Psychrobacter sp. F1192]|uniref:SGNH/GDSL hydrolase family protein n=1 Tax=Psychrobacter coccoides TaxID=2818440 RepID=A0ABS3NLY1_9GAMM|nr:SGNH/GDSL hydrolase family protein [Psychrobacter coccoides]MBO1530419.1 SGNH/GDSL hydrolase family protein [Psychrobacter coccoides]
MSLKRFIRLKELGLNLDKVYIPSADYLHTRDSLNSHEIYRVQTNSEGNQLSPWGSNSSKHIYLLGDSSIEAIYIRASMKPQSVLERLLLENRYDYKVFNLGVSGAQTLNIINLIINKLGNKKQSTVVVSVPSNDASTLRLKENYYSDDWRYASIVPATNRDPEITNEIDYDPFIKNIKMIIELCDILQLQLFMTSIIYTGNNIYYEKLNKITSEICLSKNIPFINLEKGLKEAKELFYDPLHLLSCGSNYYAKRVYEAIKPGLEIDNHVSMKSYIICNNTLLTKDLIWSERFDVSQRSIVKIVIDAEYPNGFESKQVLMAVDYGSENIKSDLARSDNKEIGYFKYINGPEGKKIEKIIELQIPEGCNKLRIGLRGWRCYDVKVHHSYISVINV